MSGLSTNMPVTLVNTRLLRLTLIATVALSPLLMLPGILHHFDITPKVAVLLAGTALALLCGGNFTYRESRPELRWLIIILLAQGTSLVLSAVFSTDPALSVTGTNWRRFGLVTQLALLAFTVILALDLSSNPRERIRPFLRAVSAAGCAAAAYGIAQYFGWDPLLPAAGYHVGEGVWMIVRPPGTMGHASYFATWLLYASFSGAALAAVEPGRWWRAIGLAAASLASIATVLSGTRAALAGLAFGAVFLAVCLKPRIRRNVLAFIALIAIASVAFYFAPAGQNLRSRMRWSAEDIHGGRRLWLWRDTLRFSARHWLLGAGPETFTSAFPPYRSEELAAAYPDFFQESPHNIFLDALAAQGVSGAASLLLLCALGFRAARRAGARSDPLPAVVASALVAGVVSQQFTSFVPTNALMLYATVAMLVVLAPALGCRERAAATPGALVGRGTRLALAGLFLYFAFHLVAADYELAQVQKRLAAGRLPEAATSYDRSRSFQPWGMNTDLWFSRRLVSALPGSLGADDHLHYLEIAERAAERAAQHSEDRPNAYYNLAAFQARRNDFARTEASLRMAIQSSPTWYKPHWMLARVLQAAGRIGEAQQEAQAAVRLSGAKLSQVIQTRDDLRK